LRVRASRLTAASSSSGWEREPACAIIVKTKIVATTAAVIRRNSVFISQARDSIARINNGQLINGSTEFYIVNIAKNIGMLLVVVISTLARKRLAEAPAPKITEF
jgi:hypothetical protein